MGLLSGFRAKLKGNKTKENKNEVVCLKYQVKSEFASDASTSSASLLRNPSRRISPSAVVLPISRAAKNKERKSLTTSFLENKRNKNDARILRSGSNGCTFAVGTTFELNSNINSVAVFETIVDREVTHRNGKINEHVTIEKKQSFKTTGASEFEEQTDRVEFNRSIPRVDIFNGLENSDDGSKLMVNEGHMEYEGDDTSTIPCEDDDASNFKINIVPRPRYQTGDDDYDETSTILSEYEDSSNFKINIVPHPHYQPKDDDDETSTIPCEDDDPSNFKINLVQHSHYQPEDDGDDYETSTVPCMDDDASNFKINIVQHSHYQSEDDEAEEVEERSVASLDIYTSKGYSSQAASIFFDDDDDEEFEPQGIRPRKKDLDGLSQTSSISA